MLDVWDVVSNSLWVLGLAVLLAVWSWARYEAYRTGVKPRVIFEQRNYTIALDAGLLLFVAGMGATEDRWWGRVLWIALGLWVIIHAVRHLPGPTRPDA